MVCDKREVHLKTSRTQHDDISIHNKKLPVEIQIC